eukprot:TRINITY_DN2451_c0_g1_i1.p1 TRINITY_DN2451_c0_g1~~TRINITY_DN2451_c0_g1_i1.p1  ORF type:complete len:556 (+),score=134.37 TRINITY_DN2451_c0_g1_i1:77-1669(+)
MSDDKSIEDDQPSWLPFDLDDILAYQTPRVVKVRDRRLGCARILIMIAIFIYIVIYEVILQKGYLLKEEPTGAVTTSLRRQGYSTTLPSYCKDGAAGGVPNGTLPCLWIDETEALIPPGEEYSMFVSTRITVVEDDLQANCASDLLYTQAVGDVVLTDATSGATCNKPDSFSVLNKKFGKSYFVGDIEKFTMLWNHAVYGPQSQLQRHHTQLDFADLVTATNGQLSFLPRKSGADITAGIENDGYVGTINGDILTVDTFVKSTDLGSALLDRVSQTSLGVTCNTQVTSTDQCQSECYWNGPICETTSQATCGSAAYEQNRCEWNTTGNFCHAKIGDYCQINTLRYDGGVFVVLIDYDTPELTSDSLGYDYKLQWIQRSEYKYVEKVKQGNKVTYYNRHGLRIIFVQTGFITKFSFTVLLTTLVGALALLAVANVIVVQVVMKLLPASAVYEKYKYVNSIDFSHVNVTPEDPLGGVEHDQFVYGCGMHPGGCGGKKKGSKNEPVHEEKPETKPDKEEEDEFADGKPKECQV